MRLSYSLLVSILVGSLAFPQAFGASTNEKPGDQKDEPPVGKTDAQLTQSKPGGADFGPFMNGMKKRIQGAWYPPIGDHRMKMITRFKVDRAGKVTNLVLNGSSGDKLMDQAALSAIQWASPFRELPPGPEKDVNVEFTFDYGNWMKQVKGTKPAFYYRDCPYRYEFLNGLRFIGAGRQALFQKQYDRALDKFKEAERKASARCSVFIDSLKAEALDGKATALASADPDGAIVIYRQALFLDSDADCTARRLDKLLEKKGIKTQPYTERLALADEFMKKRELEDARVELVRAAQLLEVEESKKKAKKQSVVELQKEISAIRKQVADTDLRIKSKAEEDKWRHYLAQQPASVEGYLSLAAVLEKGGDTEAAKAALESGLKIVPGNTILEDNLKRLSTSAPATGASSATPSSLAPSTTPTPSNEPVNSIPQSK